MDKYSKDVRLHRFFKLKLELERKKVYIQIGQLIHWVGKHTLFWLVWAGFDRDTFPFCRPSFDKLSQFVFASINVP